MVKTSDAAKISPKIDSIVVHYAEISLKGNNRQYFESMLVDNIKGKLQDMADSVLKESGQIAIRLAHGTAPQKAADMLWKIPGVANLALSMSCAADKAAIIGTVLELLEGKDFDTFKIDARRHDKNVQLSSQDINCSAGEAVIEKMGKKAKMKEPDLLVKVDIATKNAYVSCDTIQGVEGLPTSGKNKVVALLSGGFDSPVAAFMMMKRGCEVVMVHFRNSGQMKESVQDKIEQIARQLSGFQNKTKLYVVPFDNIQKEIIMNVDSSLRMLIYRRLMIKIASMIASQEKARFLVMGDSLSQVSSQTIENLEATYADSGKHILSPLIGMNKTEIINISRRIGTYDICALPYGDCCSFFMPKHPELHASSGLLKGSEALIDGEKMAEDALKSSEIIEF